MDRDRSEYLTSLQADRFIGKHQHYLRKLRTVDLKRIDNGEEPTGPAYYKEPGKRLSTKSVYYLKDDLLEWMVSHELKKVVRSRPKLMAA